MCEKIVKDDFYFLLNGERIKINPGFAFRPWSCPECHAKRIAYYMKRTGGFVKNIIGVEKGVPFVKWESFFEACASHASDDGAGLSVEDFLCAIGILTAKNDGYRLHFGGRHIEPISGHLGHYSFIKKSDAYSYAECYYRYTGKRVRYGICRITEYVFPSDMRV